MPMSLTTRIDIRFKFVAIIMIMERDLISFIIYFKIKIDENRIYTILVWCKFHPVIKLGFVSSYQTDGFEDISLFEAVSHPAWTG